jgi:hypothetical protein
MEREVGFFQVFTEDKASGDENGVHGYFGFRILLVATEYALLPARLVVSGTWILGGE